jgi:hypothetical protein
MAFLRAAHDYYQHVRLAKRESYGCKMSKVERLKSADKQSGPLQQAIFIS